jgi:hypothetical protein
MRASGTMYVKHWKKKQNKTCQPRILYPRKISFKNEGKGGHGGSHL